MLHSPIVLRNIVASKKNIYKIFNKIAHKYDLVNRVLSMGQDVAWRKKASEFLPSTGNLSLLDLASGTGDLLFSFMGSNKIKSAVGMDMAVNMLALARQKAVKKKLNNKVRFKIGDACALPVSDDSFDVATMAFGIRNVENVSKCLNEMNRILTNNGRVIILEFSLPQNCLVRSFYLFYFRYILPVIGGIISGDYKAYRYLNLSVENFFYGGRFLDLMKKSGMKNLRVIPLTFGVATLYIGDKA